MNSAIEELYQALEATDPGVKFATAELLPNPQTQSKSALFVDGCFWHGCPLHATAPKTNATFWRKKIAANRTRDRLVTRTLRTLGWRVLRIWEYELARKREPRLVRRLLEHLGRSVSLGAARLPRLLARHRPPMPRDRPVIRAIRAIRD